MATCIQMQAAVLVALLLLPACLSGRPDPAASSRGLKARAASSVKKAETATTAETGAPFDRVLKIGGTVQRNCTGLSYLCQGGVGKKKTKDTCNTDCYQICTTLSPGPFPFPLMSICNFPQFCDNGNCVDL